MIYTLEYVSTLTRPFTSVEVEQLLDASRSSNAAVGITGTLMFRGHRAMQLLEGAETEVRRLYSRIAEDPRHTDVVRVWESFHEHRRFPDWAMQFDDLSSPAEKVSEDPVWLEDDLPALAYESDGSSFLQARKYVQRRVSLHLADWALRRELACADGGFVQP